MLERIVTALVLVAVVASCMFASTSMYPMFALLTLATLGAGYEWFKLMPFKGSIRPGKAAAWLFGAVLAIVIALTLWFLKDIWILFWLAAALCWLVSIWWVKQYPQQDQWYSPILWPIGILFTVAAISAIFWLWKLSPWWLMYVFLLVWCADSGAYFAGRQWGMRKLAPEVSPNKTVEGLIGGLALSAAVVVAVTLIYMNLNVFQFAAFVLLSLITIVASVLGDLVESMIKRRAGVKDSGRILPGHGGVLDRVDSLLSATPIFAIGLYCFKILGFNL